MKSIKCFLGFHDYYIKFITNNLYTEDNGSNPRIEIQDPFICCYKCNLKIITKNINENIFYMKKIHQVNL